MYKKIIIGIPTYNEEQTIASITKQIDVGLRKLSEPKKCLIYLS